MEPAQARARFQNPHDGIFAHVLDAPQAEADGLAHRREIQLAAVHVRRQHRDAHVAASLMYFTTLSVLPVSEVSSAAMNSTG